MFVQKEPSQIVENHDPWTDENPSAEKYCKYIREQPNIAYICILCYSNPKGGMGMLQLNTVSLYQVMRDFYTLTSIRIVIFDTQFRELLAYPQEKEGFCAMIRNHPDEDARCQASDKDGCLKCAKSKELVVYRCHAGLTEAVIPIMDKTGVLAYVMFGQIIPREHCETTKAAIRKKYPACVSSVDQIPVKSASEIDAAATVLQAITAYVITNHWVIPSKSEFIREIDRYIEDHLSQSIAVEDICAALRIGRTKLYELSMDYLGCGLASYIRKQRIHHAQQLLSQTTKPITDIAFAVGFTDYNHFSNGIYKTIGSVNRVFSKAVLQPLFPYFQANHRGIRTALPKTKRKKPMTTAAKAL